MAASSESLSSYETARLALDKPLLATNAIPKHPAEAKWVLHSDIGSGDITTWIDRSAAVAPARRAYDGYPGLITTPGVSGTYIFHYVLDLGSLVEFDCAFVIGHNAGTIGLDDMDIQVADDGAFTTNVVEVADWNPSDYANDQRLAVLSLSGGRITARYVRLRYIKNTGSFVPKLGELILGRRRQLEYRPIRPYDTYALSEESSFKKNPNGVITKTIYSRRGRQLTGDLWVTDDTYLDDIAAFFRQCTGPFVWIENPNSAPSSWHFMMRDGPLSIPQTDAGLRNYRLVGDEQGPESMYLDVEENG